MLAKPVWNLDLWKYRMPTSHKMRGIKTPFLDEGRKKRVGEGRDIGREMVSWCSVP